MLSHATKLYYLEVNAGAMFLLVKSGQSSYIWFRDFILVVSIVFQSWCSQRFVKLIRIQGMIYASIAGGSSAGKGRPC